MMQPTPAPTSSGQSQEANIPPASQTYNPPPPNVDSAPFSVLVNLFEKLQSERKQDRRRKMIESWFAHWRKEKGHDLYTVLRLLLPQKDRERAIYGLKEKNLAKTYIKLIPLGIRDPDSIRLLNWKRPSDRYAAAGDFSTALYDVISKRSSVMEGSLSIDDVNEVLDELAKNMGKSDLQAKVLQRVYNNCTANEQRWISRIVLKDMIISVKEATIFSVFHPDAQDLYNTCSDLKKVAYELWDSSFRLRAEDKGVQLFQSFAPMLCKRPTRKIEETVREMGGSDFIIEEKLDGERMQLHKRGNEYFYCSRKGKDYTYLYGKHVGTGSLTPYIDQAFDSRIDEIILDGEMLVWDPISERNLPFGTLKTAALDRTKKEHNPRPCFKVFDLVYLNGQSLTNRKTSFRKKNLRSCLTEIKGRIEFAVEFKGKTAKDIRDKMDEVMATRGEGLVIKHPLSQYVLNGRNSDWIKDNMGETVELLVVAGNYGTGRRSGGVSTLVCAVFDDRRNYGDDDEPKYSTFVRIGTGLSFADYVWIREKPWKTWDPKRPPKFLEVAKKGQDDKGDVYLEPEDSFILKIKAAEITPSDQYHMGYTMRFPRALSIRDDLNIGDCMTASGILESLRSDKKRKMEEDVAIATKKKRKVTTAKKPTVLPQYQGVKKAGVQVETDILEEMKFLVMSDPKSRTGDQDKAALSKLIYANGGLCAQTASKYPDLYVVYGGTVTPYDLKLIIDKDQLDVIKPSWITDSIEAGEAVPLCKKYFFHATEARRTDEDYQMDGDGEDEDNEGGQRAASPSQTAASNSPDEDRASNSDEGAQAKLEDMDPDMAEWFKVDENAAAGSAQDDKDEGSATEPDSDNEDVGGEDETEIDLEEWFKVKTEDGKPPGEDAKQNEVPADVKMGESDDAMEYDQERIFKHLCFYLDTAENAATNGMPLKPSKSADDINKKFHKMEALIIEHGGKVVGLEDPKLTHVVLDKRDESRRLELIRRTSKPKRRHLVISEFIEACLEEETLLNEEEFMP
ncbi:hypothetical protein D9619_006679 [Psilocybe cf. subviscida]|uniref:DNA ligase n=1 Tax=Psilocybe cf. subviscida TaxID=2480587 RepID=A0A8H5EY18_9AGAR|nr:hypothetical protein D9619_006679 [Psilocybe cf. subviscida]